MRTATIALLFVLCGTGGCHDPETSAPGSDQETMDQLEKQVLHASDPLPDVTNAYADRDDAAKLGQAFFFDPGFSGPLLDHANDGLPGTLGKQGEVGRVACTSCHVPENGSFVDTRSTRGQLSFASSWTSRRTPSLLDLSQAKFLAWDGRRDTAFSVVFGVIENPVEFNSSRLFVAQQIAARYREEYEAVFGPLPPSLDEYEAIAPADAGCLDLPSSPTARCPKPGQDDEDVTRVVVNMGKAVGAYLRLLTCGPSRFDAWMQGDKDALDEDEQAGAAVFVRSKCHTCHSGPYFADQWFHNIGAPGSVVPFTGVITTNDPGAIGGLAAVRGEWLNSRGPFSDGDDDRLDAIPEDLAPLEGAFRTPSLRCIADRPSYLHNAEFRSLEDVVDLLDAGRGHDDQYVGRSELTPLGLTSAERQQLLAFLRSLQGPGPGSSLRVAPRRDRK